MAFSYSCLMLQRVLIPTVLVLAALFRPVGISFVYLLMFFISPFIPIATKRNFKGSVTAYLIILIALSSILLLCHIALQIAIIAIKFDTLFGTCSFTEQLLRHVGFVDLRNLTPTAVIEWLVPEVVVFATSLVVYLVTKRLTGESVPGHLENGEADIARETLRNGGAEESAVPAAAPNPATPLPAPKLLVSYDGPNFDKLIQISPLFCLATLFFAGVLRPSVPGGFYFLVFLLSGSYWATFQSLQRGFALVLRFVMAILVLHTLCIVAYQTPWMQQHLDSNNLIARLIGLEPLVTSSCQSDIRVIVYNTSFKADSFLSPIVLFFSYFALALTTKNLIKPRTVQKPATAIGPQLENGSNKINRQISLMTQTLRSSKKDTGWSKTQQRLNVSLRREQRPTKIDPTETTPLVRHPKRKSEHWAHATVAGGPQDIQLEDRDAIEMQEEDPNASVFDQISYGIVSVGGFIYQNSYIFTNILMMAWSIVYHGWLTFVLLLWANVLWMIPNQRKAMMRSSPFIVIYAELLVVAQYVYGMHLTNDELPSKVDTTGINLAQIGLERPQDNNVQPCVPLIVKTSFLLMFWVTLRQFFKEKSSKRSGSSHIVDMITQLTVDSAETDYRESDSKKTSKFLKKAGDVFKNLLVRLWIWLLVLVIFLCAITGKRMTGFRICYMALFLFFLLVFQSSPKAWLKVMYGFWLFLIFYAMSILILIYTYQFDKFDEYWNDYLNISGTLQSDIGLKRYHTKDLFLHLVSPTIIVILTVIQVHYFHRRFIASLHKAVSKSPTPPFSKLYGDRKRSSSMSSLVLMRVDYEQSLRDLLRVTFKKLKKKAKRFLKNCKNVFWRFLELHIIKAVYITAFLCCISELCLLHIVFAILCVLGVMSRHSLQVFISRVISFIVSIIVLAKMIYQIAYLDHSRFDVTCQDSNRTENNAAWFGLEKASPETGGLMGLVKNYIIYMIIVTLHAVVAVRQYQMRSLTGTESARPPLVLFPKVTRADAEKNLIGMFKYLFNYGFYKFGLEVTLIWLVTTISYRRDIVAVAYAIWLFVLLLIDRSKCAKIWICFQCFIAVNIIVQYVVLVQLPPGLCLSYIWTDSRYADSIQRWAMLPGNLHYSHVPKLFFDFILLMIINRQKHVFHLEIKYGKNYEGGSNESVVKDLENLGVVPFENPTRDFLSHVHNYLDVFKNAVLCGFYWVTLAVVFLAGTNISDLMALGYLIGAFIFLWQGSDFYLRPIKTIISRWNWLITYNVANILFKTCLQMVGCLFMEQATKNCCWLVHLLGISCSSKENIAVSADNGLDSDCPSTAKQVVLLWDAISFGFLILQMRIFKSHYFCHMIIDTRANNILASRGAEIIEDLRQKQIEHRQQHEMEVLHKIKRKMEKIRATQQKMIRPLEKPTHFDEPKSTASELTEPKVPVVLAAPLARNSSFSSCCGTGYHTPEDDDVNEDAVDAVSTDSAESASYPDTLSSKSSSLSGRRSTEYAKCSEPEQRINIEDDVFAIEAQTDDADVSSLSEVSDDNVLTDDEIFLQLPVAVGADRACTKVSVHSGLVSEVFLKGVASLKLNTPNSDVLTMPLDGFLDSKRISLGSFPNPDIVVHPKAESVESYKMFAAPEHGTLNAAQSPLLLPVAKEGPRNTLLLAPPIINAPSPISACSLNVNVSAGSSVISSHLTPITRHHRRQSSVNAVSWNETVSIKCTPKEPTDSAEVSQDVPVTLRQKSLHRRHLSTGNAVYSMDEYSTLQNERRRYSNMSWARDAATVRSTARPNSWGPVGTAFYMESMMVEVTESTLHGESVRAGDYYMFDDMDEKFELDMIEDEVDYLEQNDKIDEADKKLARRKTLIDVWKDIQCADYRTYMRQRSFTSAPGSRIEIENYDELGIPVTVAGVRNRTSTLSEPLDLLRNSRNELFTERASVFKMEKSTLSTAVSQYEEEETDLRPSTSKEATADLGFKKSAVDDIPKKDSDEDLEANPIVRLLEGFLVSLTIRLNRFSRNYRYVNKILAEEKKVLRESDVLYRAGLQRSSIFALLNRTHISDDESVSPLSTKRISARNNKRNSSPNNTSNHNTNTTPTTTTIINTTNNATENPPIPLSQDQPQHQQQIQAIEPHVVDITESLDTVDAKGSSKVPESSVSSTKTTGLKTEVVPEIRIKAPSFDRSQNGSGSLSKQWSHEKVDSNDFFGEEDFTTREHHITVEMLIAAWYAILSNTDLICYIVVFINQVMNASIISLPLPIMVFLWGTLSLPRPTKTFWVTLIAYTQAVVLIKCIFQFKLIWANYVNLPNQPLTPAKIFGVELDRDYATYDLLLLLVLFFHRFILKTQGLWKSQYKGQMMSRKSSDNMSVEDGGAEPVDAKSLVFAEPEAKGSPEIGSIVSSIADSSIKDKIQRDKYTSWVCKFFSNMVNKPRLPTDVYALMFLCDFVNFFVLLFGFTAFGSQQTEGDGGVQKYLAENKVPIPFLIMLLVQFILIVIDRALYLRKALVQKIVFHFLSVIGVHIWMFFIVPAVTERSFYSLAPPMIFYIIKCFYMLFSSYQIKCGYPKRILGNFLTKGFSLANMISFKVYMQIPFLYELRTILDWVCTDTTMTLFDWLKMEDIFSDIYFIKCSRQMETDFPAIRAQKKALYTKLIMGGSIILIIVISIWGPLCLFALGNAVGQANVPYEVGVSIRIGPYDPIYETNNRESIFTFNPSMYADMQNAYIKDKSAITFLSGYDAEDIAAGKLAGNSPSMWKISPPDKERLLDDLKNGVPLIARFKYTLTRIPPSKGLTGTVGSEVTFTMNSTFEGREPMINMLEGRSSEEIVTIPNMMPKFIRVLNSGDTDIVHSLMSSTGELRPLIIKIHTTNDTDDYWWEIRDFCEDKFYTNTLSKLPLVDCESGIVIYTFNDKKFPSTFSFLTAGGIIGLYTTFVLLASRFLKSFIAGSNRKIMFEDLPYVDRVLQLCLDIYLVREALEFALEEDLFAKLIFLYRSPETMIKWTRPKEELNEDETDSESVRSRSSLRRTEQLAT